MYLKKFYFRIRYEKYNFFFYLDKIDFILSVSKHILFSQYLSVSIKKSYLSKAITMYTIKGSMTKQYTIAFQFVIRKFLLFNNIKCIHFKNAQCVDVERTRAVNEQDVCFSRFYINVFIIVILLLFRRPNK